MKKHLYDGFIKPGKVFGNIYFVGTRPASTHIIDTGEGLILIDSGLPETLWIVLDNIRELGFSEKDIKVILMSHGHYDHAGATLDLVKLTCAKTYIGKDDFKMVNGQEDTSLAEIFGAKYTGAFTPDVLLSDGDIVTLGNTSVLCVSTPGHTDGTMSFFFNTTDGEKSYLAGMHGGVGTNTLTLDFLTKNGLPFENRKKYIDGINRIKDKKVEIFLGNHVKNNNTVEKLQRVAKGEKNAFLAPKEWKAFLEERIKNLRIIIEREDFMQNTIDMILKEKIIVIVRGIGSDKLLDFATAAYNGGIRLLECTFDATGNTSDEEIASNIKMLADHFEGKMLIGAGTVLTEKQVELTKNAGGKFIISPDTNKEVITKTKELGLVSIPGAFTPSEAVAAHNAGADFVKLFPITSMGSRYLKDIKAPLSHIRFLAVGGINADNMAEFLSVGACGFGIGSDIANKKLIEANNFAAIEESAKRYVKQIEIFENSK
ncbi:MAG: MBL fold metallo-hydrolase [Clostridia bacterium]|nr:MBL fold metallo-hydrolase [Clostridia bacterium]